MRNMLQTFKLHVITASVICALSPSIAVAQAQNAQQSNEADDSNVEKITVTGSRIRRTELESLQPVTVVSQEALEDRAAINVADVLNEQPAFATLGGASPSGEQGNAVGQNFANVFGLGPQRTLTLVNGQRFPAGISPNSGSGGVQVDLNNIPTALVDRIETIAIGGAPIYGTDAIAGTVNVILRKDFEGLEVYGSYGLSPEYSDNEETRFGVVAGTNFADDDGNIVFALEHNKMEGLKRVDRPVTANGLSFGRTGLLVNSTVVVDSPTGGPMFFADPFCFNTICFGDGSARAAGLPGFFGMPNGIPRDPNDPSAGFVQFDREGNLIPFVPGGGDDLIFRSGGDGLNVNELAALLTDLERVNANVFLNYELSEDLRFNGEFWYSRSEATELINQTAYNSPAFGTGADSFQSVGEGSVPVLIENPFLTTATRDFIQAALNRVHDVNGDGIADPTIDTDGDGVPDAVGFARFGGLSNLQGDNPNSATRDTIRVVLGLDGDLYVGDRDYVWDVSLAYGKTDSKDYSVEINQPNFERAVQVVDDGNGNPVCLDQSNGCVPLNVVGTPTQEAIDYVLINSVNKVTIEQTVLSANISGDVFDMPAGTVAGAMGISYRKEEASFDPDPASLQGITRNPQVPLKGSFDSKELYAEVVIPLLGGDLDTPFVESLDFEGAIRFVDNSVSGFDTTFTAGGRYRINNSLEFRGNYTRSIRAPSITELFTPPTPTFSGGEDPCDNRYIGNGNFPDRRAANCAADGITQPFQSVISGATQPGTLQGNENLSVETADSKTVGILIEPSFIEGLSLAVDWMDIEIEDAIDSLGVEDVLEGCYDSADFPNSPFCDLFVRNDERQVVDFTVGFNNVDSISFKGVQAVAAYRIDLGEYGTLNLTGNHLYTHENTQTRGANDPQIFAGQVGNNKYRTTLSAAWESGKWRIFNQLRHLSKGDFGPDRDFEIGGWAVVDTAISYEIQEDIFIQLNIDNLFDREAPYLAGLRNNAVATTYFSGINGRYATLSFRGRFF